MQQRISSRFALAVPSLLLSSLAQTMVLAQTGTTQQDRPPTASPTTPSVTPTDTPKPTPPKSNQHGYIVPFTPSSTQGAPLISLYLNSRVEATFVVDTGTGNCLISKSLVAKLGLVSYPALLVDGKPLYFNGIQPQAVTPTSLRIGGKNGPLIIQPFTGPVLIVADNQLQTLAGATVDGMIGSNLLDSFAVNFDFPSHTMMLIYPGNLIAAEAAGLGFSESGGTVLPLYRRDDETYAVPVRLTHGNVSRLTVLLVDTAGQRTQIPRRIAQDLSLKPLGQRPVFSLGDSNDNGRLHTYSINEAQVDRLGLGDLELMEPHVTYSATEINDHLAGLGLDILSGYKVLLDFPARKMYLQPPVTVAPTVQVKPSVSKAPQAP